MTINEVRAKINAKPEAAKMLKPSARNEIYLDLNGDDKADFAMIDAKGDFTGEGNITTFAVDLGSDGEFDLYMTDTDGNWVGDEIIYFKDGEAKPVIKTHPEKSGKMIESVLAEPTTKFLGLFHEFLSGNMDETTFRAGMKDCTVAVRAALRSVLEAYQLGKK
ncbi:MAG: hypothetical protein IKN81_07260 [Oscillospiraceae bacterium]|nr:hypothetical protein [Oscillospiraceae bacterium]